MLNRRDRDRIIHVYVGLQEYVQLRVDIFCLRLAGGPWSQASFLGHLQHSDGDLCLEHSDVYVPSLFVARDGLTCL